MSKPKLRTVGCFIEYNNKFILLHRQPSRPQGDTWGLPAGKVRKNESDENAVLREVEEETGYKASSEELEFLGDFAFDFPDLYLEFPTYRIKLKESIRVNHRPDEHKDFTWVTAEECYAMPNLIRGLHDLLKQTGYIKE